MTKKKSKSTWGGKTGTIAGGAAGAVGGAIIALPTGELGDVVTVPIGIAVGAGIGKKYGSEIGGEIDRLVDDAKSFIGKAGGAAERGLKTTRKKMVKAQKRHKKHTELVDYLWVWINEIDKRLKMGHKEYHRMQRRLGKHVAMRKHQIKKVEEKIL